MTANHEHTPTTEQVRFAATFPNENFSLKGSDFDRWLAARDARIEAAAEQRGAERALRDAAETSLLIDYMYGYFADDSVKSPAAVRATATYLHTRADRIANKEGDDERN